MVAKSYTSTKTGFQELKQLGDYYKKNNIKSVCVSGGFDPLHVGHLEMILSASLLGDELVVLVNSDNFLMKKKGIIFMPQEERLKIVFGIKGVSQAFIYDDNTQFVDKGLAALRPDIFYNGGDRQSIVPEEEKVCKELGIRTEFGGEKIQSSSDLCWKFYINMARKRFREC